MKMKVALLEVSLMNFILRISKVIKWRVKAVLLEVSLMYLILRIWSNESESGVIRSFIDELHSWDIEGDQMKRESGFTRSMIDQLHSSDIQGDQIEG